MWVLVREPGGQVQRSRGPLEQSAEHTGVKDRAREQGVWGGKQTQEWVTQSPGRKRLMSQTAALGAVRMKRSRKWCV